MHSGCMVQNPAGDFEVAVAHPQGGFSHFTRDNHVAELTWQGPHFFGCATVSEPSLLEGDAGVLEVFATTSGQVAMYQRTKRWHGPSCFGSGVKANPAVIRKTDGEVYAVAAAVDGGFVQFRRAAGPGAPWETLPPFGADAGQVESVAMLQSNFGDSGNLEILAVVHAGGIPSLCHFWSAGDTEWFGPNVIDVSGVLDGASPMGVPAFLQSTHGAKGHFEAVVALTSGGLAHFRRDNDGDLLPWMLLNVFGSGMFTSVGMVQSSFGSPGLGNFEVVARVDGRFEHYWCHDESLEWYGPTTIAEAESAADPALKGIWHIEHICEPVGIHAALLKTNKVLFFAYHEEDHAHGVSSVFDLQDGSVQHVEQDEDLFCSGHAFLPDGRLLVTGGHLTGEKSVFVFTPAGDAGTWQQLADMPLGRWYPTCTALPDGTIFVCSGAKQTGGGPINDSYQIFDPQNGMQPPHPAPFFTEMSASTYPWVFLLPSGKLLIFASHLCCLFDLATMSFEAERFHCIRDVPRTYPLEGTSVLLPLLPDSNPPYRARVMVIGGAGVPLAKTTPATNTCEIFDTGDSPAQWTNAPAMISPRVMPDSVLLPDGTVLVMNGSSTGKADEATEPVLDTEIYDPVANEWRPAAAMRVPRLYHATALLLPDGTVMTAGLDEAFNVEPFKYPEYRLEFFHPPYLFRGPRPQIQASPAAIHYGVPFVVHTPDAGSIATAAILRNGVVTHSFNMDQRYTGLTITERSADTVTIEAPPNGNVAPPGQYLLFLLDGDAVPSVGQFISVV